MQQVVALPVGVQLHEYRLEAAILDYVSVVKLIFEADALAEEAHRR
jgi:hypothetical protein